MHLFLYKSLQNQVWGSRCPPTHTHTCAIVCLVSSSSTWPLSFNSLLQKSPPVFPSRLQKSRGKPTPLWPSNKVPDIEWGGTEPRQHSSQPPWAFLSPARTLDDSRNCKGTAWNPSLAGVPSFSAPKAPLTGGKPRCWMAENGAWLFKSQANGSWAEG